MNSRVERGLEPGFLSKLNTLINMPHLALQQDNQMSCCCYTMYVPSLGKRGGKKENTNEESGRKGVKYQ